MGYKLWKRGDVWWVYFLDRRGGRFRRSTKHEDKRRATFVADEWYRRHADPTYSAADETTIQDAAGRLKAELKHRKRSQQTIEHFYRIKLSQVARVMGADTSLSRIDARMVDEFIAARESEGASHNTIGKELTALRQLLKSARRRGEFDKEVSQVMPIAFDSGYKPRQTRVTQEQAWALIAALPDNVARYAAFVCATTARDSAANRARGRHLLGDGIEVLDRKTKLATRVVPLNVVTEPFARFAFKDVAPDQAVAPGIGSVRHAFDRATERTELPHLSPNDLRRSVAHWLLAGGVPRDAAAAFMGHANTKMLDLVYGKLDSHELGETIRRNLRGPGSRVDAVWKNEVDPVDAGGAVDTKKAEKLCAGTESNRRHGDFQSHSLSGERPTKRQIPRNRVDGVWKKSRGSGAHGAHRRRPPRTVQDYVAERLLSARRHVEAGNECATLTQLAKAARALCPEVRP